MRADDFARKALSPTASASSISRIRGCTDVAMAKCSRARIPDEYVRSGRLIASPMSVNSTISSIFSLTSAFDMPRARQPRRMLRYPEAAAINVAPTPSSLGSSATRISPLVGASRPATAASKRRLAGSVGPDDADRVAFGGVEGNAP